MQIFLLSRFGQELMWLAHTIEQVGVKMAKDGEHCKVDNEERKNIHACLEQLKNHCLEIKLNSVANPCFLLSIDLQLLRKDCYYRDVEKGLRAIHWAIIQDLTFRKFVFIPPNKDDYLEQERMFGDEVFNKFPSARSEIKSAGNCITTDLYDAAVFHLMLAMNCGLLALAKELGVTPEKKPLEYEEWHILIRNIETKLREKAKAVQDKTAAGQSKDAELDFYQGLLDNLKYTKDAHRNPIAHARGDYDEPKALAVFSDVRRFMERLAKRVSE